MSPSSFSRDRRGVAAVEFALAAPLLLLLSLGTADVVFWMRARMRMEQAASQVALIAAQYSILYEGDFAGIFQPVAQAAVVGASLACPGGGMVVTGIDNPSGTPAVKWRWTNAPPDGSCKPTFVTAGGGPSIARPAVLSDYAPPSSLSAVTVELAAPWSGFVFSRGLLELFGASIGDVAGPFTIRTYAVAVPRPGTLPPVKTGSRPS